MATANKMNQSGATTPEFSTMYKELNNTLENIHRLDALKQTFLMDSPPDAAFDRLTRLAARILHAPVALVSLVDDRRQFFKSCIGLPTPWATRRETPLSHSFCQYVVLSQLPLIVNDAREHPFLCDNLAVAGLGVIAYAGIPIRISDGHVLGSFCVIDTKPRVWTEEEVEILTELTSSVITEIELHSAVREAIERASDAVSSEARKHAILESALDCIITIDEDGTVLEFNPAAERTFGYRADQAIGKKLVNLIVPPDLRDAHNAGLRRFMTTGVSKVIGKRIEITAVNADGTEFPVELAISVIHQPRPVFTAYLRDITAQRASAAALALARRNEVEIGAKIQQTLLVRRPQESMCGFGIGARSQASQGIDGDYFDFFGCDGNCFDFLIGDVMGKGIPAALLGAASKSHFQRAIRRLQLSMNEFGRLPHPEEILNAVHTAMTRELVQLDSFITLCYARFDPRERCVKMIDCGHTRTIHYHASTNSCSLLQGDNLPLGVREDEVFIPITVPLERGDVLVFYSDGVTEARNAQEEFFGEARLLHAVQEGIHCSPQELVEHICTCVSEFSGRDNFADDLTCVAIRFDEDAQLSPTIRVAREFTSSLTELEAIRQYLRRFLQVTIPQPLNDEITYLMLLAVNEAVTNIIRHAYGGHEDHTIQIIAKYYPDSITLYLEDGGQRFNSLETPGPVFDGSQDHGFGMFIIAQCMDEVCYEHNNMGRNCLTLTRKIVEGDRLSTKDREPTMKFETEMIGTALLVRLPGTTLDASNSGEFKREIAPFLHSNAKVIFDLGQLTFIDSSGLGAILSCLRQLNGMQGDLKLCQMQKTVRVLFELVRMHRVFDILDTPEEAAAAFKS